MRKFNKLFKAELTHVQIEGFNEWFLIKKIHPLRKLIELHDLQGSFQRNHVTKFTNQSI